MPVLVLDTSSAAVTAAVVDMGGSDGASVTVRAQRETLNPRGHGELLAPSVQESLDEAGVRPGDLSAVVAGLGPGPFTGLRVGLVTAAVLADMLDIPTYGVCSLDAIGHACADEPDLLVVTDARRHEVYWARYRHGVRAGGPEVCRPADIDTRGLTAVAGAAAGGRDFGVRRRDVDYPPAAALAALAATRHAQHAPTEVLTPLYLRRPDAIANTTPKPVTPAGETPAAATSTAATSAAATSAAATSTAATSAAKALELVPMRPEHVDELMAYERDMFGTEAWSHSAYLTELADTRNRYYVAAREGDAREVDRLVGWAGVLMAGDQAEILTVGVVPAARRRGIARRLVAALVTEALRRGAREAFLEVRVDNAAARQLYASDGFAEVDIRRGYYDGGRVDAVVMRRDL